MSDENIAVDPKSEQVKKEGWTTKKILGGVLIVLSLGVALFSYVSLEASYKNGYEKGAAEFAVKAYQSGYVNGIADTQNATLSVGYCKAQQDIYRSGILTANNTVLVVPVTILNEVCFR